MFVVTSLVSADSKTNLRDTINKMDVSELSKHLNEIRQRYSDKEIIPNSEDYVFLDALGKLPFKAKGVIPELINMVGILEPFPPTTEDPTWISLSPASRALVALDSQVENAVRDKISAPEVPATNKIILGEVLKLIKILQSPDRGQNTPSLIRVNASEQRAIKAIKKLEKQKH